MRRPDSGRATRGSRRGFTLVEVLVALALSGLVLLSAHALLSGVGDRAHALALGADTLTARATGARTLRLLVGQLEVGTPASGPFAGAPGEVSSTSWCDMPAGWQERCAVTLDFEAANGVTLSIHVGDGMAGRATAYLESGALDAWVAYLARRGVQFEQMPKDEDWGWREARLSDPAGNRLCLYQAGEYRRYPPWRI